MNVFELNNAINQVQEKDLDPETLKDTLESLELPRNEKLDNVASWIEQNQMKLSKETIKKLWATTDAVSDGQTKKANRAND